MATREARTRATRNWRSRTGAKLVQAYLLSDIVDKLDALVKSRGSSGRANVLAELIEDASLPGCPAAQAPFAITDADEPQADQQRDARLALDTVDGHEIQEIAFRIFELIEPALKQSISKAVEEHLK